MTPTQTFSRDAYYTWFTNASPLSTILGGVAMVAVMLAGVMFPLWPPIMRLGVWYLSMGVLGLVGVFIGIAVVRLVLWLVTSLVLRRGIWWFPRLFDDVGVVDSFIPFWAWDDPPPKKTKRKTKTSSSKSKPSSGGGVTLEIPLLDVDTAPTSEQDDGSAAKASAVEMVPVGGGAKRREAYVEDAEDDE